MQAEILPETLPDDVAEVEALKQTVRDKLQGKLMYYSLKYPDKARPLSEETMTIIFESIAECYVLLGLTDDQLPDFFVFNSNDLQDESLGLIDRPMWINDDSEDEQPASEDQKIPRYTWYMNYDHLRAISDQMAVPGSELGKMLRDDLRRMVGHEVHHIYDLIFFPERAAASGIANDKSDIALLDPGENAAQQFGFRYRDLKYDQDKLCAA